MNCFKKRSSPTLDAIVHARPPTPRYFKPLISSPKENPNLRQDTFPFLSEAILDLIQNRVQDDKTFSGVLNEKIRELTLSEITKFERNRAVDMEAIYFEPPN